MESGIPASFLARLNCFSTDSIWPEADCREGNIWLDPGFKDVKALAEVLPSALRCLADEKLSG